MNKTEQFIKTIEHKIIIDKNNGEELIFHKSIPFTYDQIHETETKIGVKLPESFKDFLHYCGAAEFYGMKIYELSELDRLDKDCWEMEGMIPFTVDPFGRNHCFKPHEGATEYEIYITSHDPFGYGKVADSFYDWCKLQNSIMLNFELDNALFKHPFLDVNKTIIDSWKRYQSTLPKKWYEFWK